MKILLIGEYSRLHNSLKEGLIALGHQVTLVSSGDGLKQFESDYLLTSKIKNNRFLSLLNSGLIRLFGVNLIQNEYYQQFKKLLPQFKNFDVVQLINEDALGVTPKQSIKLYSQLFKQNKSIYLLACGEDYVTINYFLNPANGYSVLTPYLNNTALKNTFNFSLKYTTKAYKNLHEFINKNINGVICSDMDYHRAYINHSKYLGLIPNPINTDLLEFKPLETDGKIHIFHGINSTSSLKKGANYFSEALQIIANKYPEKISISSTTDLPYTKYIQSYDQAHIILDQIYSYDQGYNALEAMYKGKVLFTGAEKEWLQYYNLKENSVAINALPNADYLVEKLEWLINNPNQIQSIGSHASAFVKQHHDYITIAQRYLDTWNKN
jgi:glycosyltransferase involved in cell wall biosynthesis